MVEAAPSRVPLGLSEHSGYPPAPPIQAAGRGVAQDYVQAHMWYNLAASRMLAGGNRDKAVNNRDKVETGMTPAQVAEAQKLAREWMPKAQADN